MFQRILARSGVTTLIFLTLAACGGAKDTTVVDPPKGATPASIEIALANRLVIVGFPTSVAAIVRDVSGNALAGRTIAWISRDTTVATVTSEGAIVGKRVGITDVVATVNQIVSLPLRIYVARGFPAVLTGADGRLTGVVGQAVTSPVVALVVDANGSPVPGVPVKIVAANGSGAIAAIDAQSDSAGRVPAGPWTLGTKAGLQQLLITSGSLTGSIDATAQPGPPAAIKYTRTDERMAAVGRALSDPLDVVVTDVFGNTVPGRTVQFTASAGSVFPTTIATDDAGVARTTWTMPATVGDATLSATVASVAPATTRAFAYGFRAKAVFAGSSTSCALDLDDVAWCWGDNRFGQVGTGQLNAQVTRPQRVSGNIQFKKIAPGPRSTCGLAATGEIYCWGENQFGQLGDGVFVDHSVPLPVETSQRFTDLIALAVRGFCGVTAAGDAYCWGENTFGALGIGTGISRTASPSRMAVSEPLLSVSSQSCALGASTTWYCWGFIQMTRTTGEPFNAILTTPYPVLPTSSLTALSGLCGVTTAGGVLCRGSGTTNDGQLVTWSPPISVPLPDRVNTFHGNSGEGCAITQASRLYCWGFNDYGEVGAGDFLPHPGPVEIGAGRFVAKSVSKTNAVVCAVDQRQQVWCWGNNAAGALAQQTLASFTAPTPVYP